ncbi:hypothetical protein [Reyranella sp.]
MNASTDHGRIYKAGGARCRSVLAAAGGIGAAAWKARVRAVRYRAG